MVDLSFLATLTNFVAANAPVWLAALSGTLLTKGQDALFDKVKDRVIERGDSLRHRIFRLDDKARVRHLEQALRNATERGLAACPTPQDRALYNEIIRTLSQPGPSGTALRDALLQLFTLTEEPDLDGLSDIYNAHLLLTDPNHQQVDAASYLNTFFSHSSFGSGVFLVGNFFTRETVGLYI